MLLASAEFRGRLKRLRLAAERLAAGRRRGQRTSRAIGGGLEFAGHRPYSPGDDTRYLDWNAHARLDQLVLKQFEAPGELTVVLGVDCAPTMRFGSPDKLDHAKTLAAAIGYLSLHAGDRCVLNPLPVGSDGKARSFQSVGQELPLLESLDRLSARDDPARILQWLGSIRELRGDLLVVLVTDFLNRKPMLEALRELGRMRAKTLVIHTVAPEEVHPELAGRTKVELVGSRTRNSVTLDIDAAVLEEYRREFEQFRFAIAAACRRARAGLVETLTAWEMEELVLGLVGSGVLRVKRS